MIRMISNKEELIEGLVFCNWTLNGEGYVGKISSPLTPFQKVVQAKSLYGRQYEGFLVFKMPVYVAETKLLRILYDKD